MSIKKTSTFSTRMIVDGISGIGFLSPDFELAGENLKSFVGVENVEGEDGAGEFAFVAAVAAEFEDGWVGVGNAVSTT